MITKICKRVLLTLFTLQFSFLSLEAQTVSSIYQPGVTAEGAVYFLPKTAVNITIQVEKTTYTPGDFCLYAERYLRIKDVSPTPDVSYRITAQCPTLRQWHPAWNQYQRRSKRPHSNTKQFSHLSPLCTYFYAKSTSVHE